MTSLYGAEAMDFAKAKLRKLKTNAETWEVEYEDPQTGDRWLMDYPNSEAQGGGSPRLRMVHKGTSEDQP